jgi:putative sterol carrier protein
MAGVFPSQEWLDSLKDHLNSDEKYARVGKNWEGDIVFDIQPEGALTEGKNIYLDLWHGKCRNAYFFDQQEKEPTFVLQAPFGNFARVLKSELDPMTAMMTRKLKVRGSMTYMMRNVPTVLEFVRCAQDVTDEILGH